MAATRPAVTSLILSRGDMRFLRAWSGTAWVDACAVIIATNRCSPASSSSWPGARSADQIGESVESDSGSLCLCGKWLLTFPKRATTAWCYAGVDHFFAEALHGAVLKRAHRPAALAHHRGNLLTAQVSQHAKQQ